VKRKPTVWGRGSRSSVGSRFGEEADQPRQRARSNRPRRGLRPEPSARALTPFGPLRRLALNFKRMEEDRDRKRAEQPMILAMLEVPQGAIADAAKHARFFPGFLRRRLGQAAAAHRPALRNHPSSGAAPGDEQDLDAAISVPTPRQRAGLHQPPVRRTDGAGKQAAAGAAQGAWELHDLPNAPDSPSGAAFA
jgi:hypothetical protein